MLINKIKNLFNYIISKHNEYNVRKNLKQSCKEVKLMQDCKLPKESWKDFAKRIEK